ncbi:MAG: TIGR04084 family radical SAM/SPASM domain-containing protein [Theionarchaea archaeon]|nr:TIGR04084 family radical SAM/SPASM domain-containing protein [Theionarchaea archaeon]MBU7038839.1 TIGR04084 family radical SAM/SPASM domain-containing protein [Theionarchaea archaeon]
MHYHLILTDQCNLKCRYCYEKSILDSGTPSRFTYDFSAPSTFSVSIERLKRFLEKDENPIIIFYGGEPLLELEKMMKIMDSLDVPYRIQTNGLLLDRVPREYVKRVGRILVSLDGDRDRTDHNRGEHTFDTVMGNIRTILPWYPGEIVARITIAQDCPDICEQVQFLVGEGFRSIHWQLDAGFYGFDFDERRFAEFVEKYNESIGRLVTFWVRNLEKGNFLRLYPFVGIISSLLDGETTRVRCGAGHAGYCITTDGKVVACPIGCFATELVAGNLETHPEDLKKFDVSGRCLECVSRDICGGRCLYWNKTRLWPEEGDNLICNTVSHLIRELKEVIPVIEKMISCGVVRKEDFAYEKYFGPEIIP